jgi:hypothetical protein
MFIVVINEVNARPMHFGPFHTHSDAFDFMATTTKDDHRMGLSGTTYQIVKLTDPATGD